MENTTSHLTRRLKLQAHRMLKALEALPTPETYAEIARAARAVITVKKALELLYPEDADAHDDEAAATPEPALPPVMNRQMRRRLEAEARRMTLGVQSLTPALQTSAKTRPKP